MYVAFSFLRHFGLLDFSLIEVCPKLMKFTAPARASLVRDGTMTRGVNVAASLKTRGQDLRKVTYKYSFVRFVS